MTATIQISNSDNKLTRVQWAAFVDALQKKLQTQAEHIHFFGTSVAHAPWQDACWVVGFDEINHDRLCASITMIREEYHQDSAAITFGTTEFI